MQKTKTNAGNDGPKRTPQSEGDKLGRWRLKKHLESLYLGELTLLDPPEKAKGR